MKELPQNNWGKSPYISIIHNEFDPEHFGRDLKYSTQETQQGGELFKKFFMENYKIPEEKKDKGILPRFRRIKQKPHSLRKRRFARFSLKRLMRSELCFGGYCRIALLLVAFGG